MGRSAADSWPLRCRKNKPESGCVTNRPEATGADEVMAACPVIAREAVKCRSQLLGASSAM